jgi:hypothetical protein
MATSALIHACDKLEQNHLDVLEAMLWWKKGFEDGRGASSRSPWTVALDDLHSVLIGIMRAQSEG